MENTSNPWIERVIQLAEENAAIGGGPFAALVVRGEEIVASGVNCVHTTCDPSSHAELLAIRDACMRLGKVDLSDCELYASGEPCPMCMGAIYWAKLGSVYYACSKKEAASGTGFVDPLSHFYSDMLQAPEKRTIPFQHMHSSRKLEPFNIWAQKHNG
ncbi:nucleoside deaminase [Paenibacillus allorhizosphaerae]|uniref:Guanine deaminase n=1 Tax=Paenibacillus allorhizosphaerae TaxID=2849866 RepID=A0ABN7TPI0_9BACL|nr:nucleoside deaminase [Paenibacillus allorhizosphaerae]CAG7644991.1 Guanine deaminase [Paenibacillus allorhizosphaerae]